MKEGGVVIILFFLLVFEDIWKLSEAESKFLEPKIYTNREDLWVEHRIYSFKSPTYLKPYEMQLICNSSIPIIWDFEGKYRNWQSEFQSKRIIDNRNPNNTADFVFEISVKVYSTIGASGRYICKSIQNPNISDSVFVLGASHIFFTGKLEIGWRLDQKEIRLSCIAQEAPVVASLFKLKKEGEEDKRINITGLSYVRYDLTIGFDLLVSENQTQDTYVGEYECILEYLTAQTGRMRASVHSPDGFIHSPQLRDELHLEDIFCASKDPIQLRYNIPSHVTEEEAKKVNITHYENQTSPYRYNAIAKAWVGDPVVGCFDLKTNSIFPLLSFKSGTSAMLITISAGGGLHLECSISDGAQRHNIETFECDTLGECTFVGNTAYRFFKENQSSTRSVGYIHAVNLRSLVATCSPVNLEQSRNIFVLDMDRNFFKFSQGLSGFDSNRLVRISSHQLESYVGENVTFTCSFVRFFLGEIHWAFKYLNGSIHFQDNRDGDGDKVEILSFMRKQHKIIEMDNEFIKQILCYAPYATSFEWAVASSNIVVNARRPPYVIGSNKIEIVPISQTDDDTRLICEVTAGYPKFNITWEWEANYLEGIKFREDEAHTKTISTLTIPKNVTIKEDKSFACFASNIFGSTKKKFTVTAKRSILHPGIIVGIVAVIIMVILVAVIFSLLQRRKLKKLQNRLTENDIKGFLEGVPGSNGNSVDPLDIAFPEDSKILRNNIEIGEVLGYGAYGIVFKGTLQKSKVEEQDISAPPLVTVAIKALKQGANIQYVRSLLLEIKTMVHVGQHDHIVKFYGACVENIQTNEIYVVLELCENGSLEGYLRKNRSNFQSTDPSQMNYSNLNTNAKVTTRDLLQWSHHIVSAMSYLAQKRVVHGDLATRNVLLTGNLTARVADFGLSKHVYNYTQFTRKRGEDLLPWRWMAVEALRDMEFSIQSDVWSFGVTLWEIFSLAEVPYGGLGYTLEFVNMLKLGFRLPKPEHASDQIYGVIMDCWHTNSASRPSIDTLKSNLRLIGKSTKV